MMDTMKIALMMLLLCGTVFPAIACISNATDVIFGQQYGVRDLILAVITLTIVIIAIAYALGAAMNNANFTVFAKDELYHLGFSIVILVSMSGIVLFSCMALDFFSTTIFGSLQASGALTSGCYSTGATMQDVASCYADKATDDATTISRIYIQDYISYMMDSTFSWNIQWPLMNSYTSTADSYKRIVSNQYDMIVNTFLIPALLSLSMQKLALQFIKDNVVNWLLPTAFLLRVFIPTRQMGNMLIALSLGLYIIVPFLYVFNFTMYDAALSKQDCVSDASLRSAVCDFYADGNQCGPSMCDSMEGFWQVARLVPQAFFLPNLTIVVLITFLTAMNKALKVMG